MRRRLQWKMTKRGFNLAKTTDRELGVIKKSPQYISCLAVFLLIHTWICWFRVIKNYDWDSVLLIVNSMEIIEGTAAVVFPFVTFVFSGLISNNSKARLIYFRWKNPLPGSQAFTKYMIQEPRADRSRLIQKWGTLPIEPDNQNKIWYKMLQDVKRDRRVFESHRSWLISRELATYSALLLPIVALVVLITSSDWISQWTYLLGLLIQLFVCISAARNYGIRFIQTVLTVASQQEVECQ